MRYEEDSLHASETVGHVLEELTGCEQSHIAARYKNLPAFEKKDPIRGDHLLLYIVLAPAGGISLDCSPIVFNIINCSGADVREAV